MTVSEKTKKFEKLADALYDFGLSYSDVQSELEKQRTQLIFNSKCKRSVGCFSSVFEKVSAEQIEFSGYEFIDGNKLMDWILVDLRGNVVLENLGKFDKNLFDKNLSSFALFEKNGKYYPLGDGNHRALLWKMQYIFESAAAKTKKEKNEIEKKFTFSVPVVHEEKDERVLNGFERVVESLELSDKQEALDQYISDHSKGRNRGCELKFDFKTHTYSFAAKGNKIEKQEKESLLRYMSWIEQQDPGVVVWEFDGTYYVAKENFVIKTTSKNELQTFKKDFSRINNSPITNGKYVLEIDGKVGSIFVQPQMIVKDKEKIKNLVRFYEKHKDFVLQQLETSLDKNKLGSRLIYDLFDDEKLQVFARRYQKLSFTQTDNMLKFLEEEAGILEGKISRQM